MFFLIIAEWWNNYGDEGPHLQKIAIKILSQTCSSSGCERNWSTWSLIHPKLRNRLAMKKLHKLVYVHYNMRLRVKNLMQERSDEDLYNIIDLNHIFNDDDILDEWIREGEEPILSSDNLDWLDQDLPFREGREESRDDDGDTSYRISRRGSSIVQGRDIGSSCKGKALRIIFSNSSSGDGDDRVNRGGSNIGGDSENCEDTSGDNGASGGIGSSGAVDSGYVNQVDHGMSWAQGNEIIMPHKILIMDMGTTKAPKKTDYIS